MTKRLCVNHRRLSQPGATFTMSLDWSPTPMILLRASDWCYKLGAVETDLLPPLAELLDDLISTSLTRGRDNKAVTNWSNLLIAYLYDTVPDLSLRAYAQNLSYENRQFHYDQHAGMTAYTAQFTVHERNIRDALLAGTFELCDCSATEDNEDLFTDKGGARLRAAMNLQSPDEYLIGAQKQYEEDLAELKSVPSRGGSIYALITDHQYPA